MYINFDRCIHTAGGEPFKTVLHIGAHYGQELAAYENNGVQKIIWIDGNEGVFEELKSKTSHSKLEQVYLCACLSDEEKEVDFHVANNGLDWKTDGQSSSLLEFGTHAKMYPQVKYVEHKKVYTRRFDQWAEEQTSLFEMREIDFVNIDVQGAELKVLKGFGHYLLSSRLRAIYTEINLEEVYKGCCLVGELDSYLQQFGFKRVLTKTPERTWGDSLYLR